MTKPGGEDVFGREQGAAFDDVSVALSLLSGGVIHEVTHTLNFLRLLLDERASGADAELTRFANAELERMQRMVKHLRRLKLPAPDRAEVSLADVVAQSIEPVRESFAQRSLSIDARIPAEVVIRDDAECLKAALRIVLQDVLERAPTGSSVAIAVTTSAQPLQLELSDEGDAMLDLDGMALNWQNAAPSKPQIFRRTLAHRLLHHLGWSMSHERRAQCNVTLLTAPMPMSRSR